MSISSALSNALSGLNAASRAASVVSSNVSNALNEDYGRRDVELASRAGGVRVVGTTRHESPLILHDMREAGADQEYSGAVLEFRTRAEDILGTPEDEDSLAAQIAKFETALIAVASRPDLPERLSQLLSAAKGLAERFGYTSNGLQSLREQADAEIDASVKRLNELLGQAEDLNTAITRATHTGGETASLVDHRKKVIDEISTLIPVREITRDGGAVALMSQGGHFLLDGRAAELGFTATGIITPHQTIGDGFLSGLTINGDSIATDGSNATLASGALAARFRIRDDLAVELQTRIDMAARDLIDRFQQSGLDVTRTAGAAGLFTDSGNAFDPADEVGLAARIAVSALVDPAQGGATWRLRDGLGATTAGPPGDSTLLMEMIDVLNERRVPSDPALGTSGITASALATTILSLTGTERLLSEQGAAFDSTRQSELKERYLAEGVDTDQEMQRLMLIEQAYAANARVVQVMDDLMKTLIGL
ncbi:flagellar hook-associated protein [Primorskyibacter flagellatus]|uniref:Flagellar hook-associated protein 1 n=1 Tax=Primorskyibacter flagellatus TaxID=1387277 RepID=A0A917AAM3_9RHOB|nr:flagellar hook-associated protein FlgK [Primorskyibacter flagellatus]GGE38406.1 flagellar hook-associated protein [Primorskyibacter flagellatus]